MKSGKTFMNHVGTIFCQLGKLLRKRTSRKAVLIIKDDGLGDLILWLPYQAEIRKYYPVEKYRIDLVVKSQYIEISALIPWVDRVLVIPDYRNRFHWTCFRLLFYLTHAYDIVCNITVSPHGMWYPYRYSNLVTMLLKDSVFENASKYFKNVVYTDRLNIRERYQAVLKILTGTSEVGNIDYGIFKSSLEPVSKTYCVICPGAGDSRRCWEPEKYIQLIERILSKWTGCAILVGTAKERDLGEQIRMAGKYRNRIHNMCGDLSVSKMFTLISRSCFLVSNDTGTCHIGAALGVKTFIICGQGDYGSFVPYPEGMEGKQVFSIFSKRICRCQLWGNEECRKQSVYPCIAEISADEVWEVIKKHVVKIPEGI